MWAESEDGELERRGVMGERIEKATWGWSGGFNLLSQEAEWPEPSESTMGLASAQARFYGLGLGVGAGQRACQWVLTQVLWWGARRRLCPSVHVLVWDAVCVSQCVGACTGVQCSRATVPSACMGSSVC